MRIAFISDVHANLEALQATLSDIQKKKVDSIHFLGDAVGYGCDPNACVGLIDQSCEIKLLGNHDFAALGLESTEHFNEIASVSLEWTRKELTDRSLALMADFELESVSDELHLVHASPRAPELWEYVLTIQEAREQFECTESGLLCVGHSHVPTAFTLTPEGSLSQRTVNEMELEPGNRHILNVGSVGQPRDHDPRACYVTLDTDKALIRYHRVEYDVAKTVSRMGLLGLPQTLSERLLVGR
ncbi:MAG: metallophosphoesterase family protein [Candidatus Zixiibacteriota bacterium]